MSARRMLAISVVVAGMLLGTGVPISATPIVNGDFSAAELDGYIATGAAVSEPTGEFALLETDGSYWRTLEQTFLIPSVATRFSFDFAFSTEGTSEDSGYPDSFAASIVTDTGDYLDIFVGDLYGPLPDPSDGIESYAGALPLDADYDDSVGITGFVPFTEGTTFSGRISLWLPEAVLGKEATVYFDLFDEMDGFATRAAVDNISAAPVPEPATLLLLGGGLAGLLGVGRRSRRRPAH